VSTAELETNATFRARVARIRINEKEKMVLIVLKTESGEDRWVGAGIGGVTNPSPSLEDFARTLQRNKSCEFPRDWLEFKAKRGGLNWTNQP
jgi:hypothetical protein